MTKQERFDKILSDINDATNDIAADQQKLLEEIKAGSVTDESLAKAEQNVAALQAIGAQVDSSTPPVDEEPPVEEEPAP